MQCVIPLSRLIHQENGTAGSAMRQIWPDDEVEVTAKAVSKHVQLHNGD
jgi:hypothetical protein